MYFPSGESGCVGNTPLILDQAVYNAALISLFAYAKSKDHLR